MKRFYLLALLFFVSLPVLAATKNKISMVTYFPVPYVAYSQVNTTDQMDIGLTNTCDMKLGCSEESATLNATRVNLKGGKLNLDGGRGIKGYTLSLGSGSVDGRISFQNVRIQTGNMESVNAQDMKVSALKLFGKTFPSCKEKDPSGQMQWASLKLKGAPSNELYLMCGVKSDSSEKCQPPNNLPNVYTEDCEGSSQKITYTWDDEQCTFVSSGTCPKVRYLSSTRYCQQENHDVSVGEREIYCTNGSGGFCTSCGNGANRVWRGNFYSGSSSVQGGTLGNKVRMDYKFAEDIGCEAGAPCAACELGKKYLVSDSDIWFCDRGISSTSLTMIVQYVLCAEQEADADNGYAGPDLGSDTSCSLIPNY